MTHRIYEKSNCPQCTATKRMFDREQIPYETISLEADPSALEFVLNLGHKSAPVVYANSENHWSGFRPDLIAKLKGA